MSDRSPAASLEVRNGVSTWAKDSRHRGCLVCKTSARSLPASGNNLAPAVRSGVSFLCFSLLPSRTERKQSLNLFTWKTRTCSVILDIVSERSLPCYISIGTIKMKSNMPGGYILATNLHLMLNIRTLTVHRSC